MTTETPRVIGRYTLFGPLAAGGMAAVHLGRVRGAGGFSRVVAIKRLHAFHSADPVVAAKLVNEARLMARIRHASVVSILDVVASGDDVLIVMEYVQGESLFHLARAAAGAGEPAAVAIASRVMSDVLRGLHAAHEAVSEQGDPLGIVHRDVSPQNILVGDDGIARVVDFGIAKARSSAPTTREGTVTGKLAYMAPEQVERQRVSRETDVFAASIVLWELLAGARLFDGDGPGAVAAAVLSAPIPRLRTVRADAPVELEAVLHQGLTRERELRFPTALAMAEALERAATPAPASVVATWVRKLAGVALQTRTEMIAAIERSSADDGDAHAAPLDDLPPAVSVEVRAIEGRVHRAQLPTAPGEFRAPNGGAASGPGATDSARSTSTEASVEASASPRRSRIRNNMVLLLFAIGIGVGVASVAAGWMRPRDRGGSESAEGAAPESTPSSTQAALESPSSSTSAHVTSSAEPPHVSGPPVHTSPPRSASPLARPRPGCDPPYYWDRARGIKVFKTHCVR